MPRRRSRTARQKENSMSKTTSPAIQIEQLDGDDTVLCVLVAARHKIVAVVNTRYPEAEAHARQHVAAGFEGALICGPDCDGTQH